MGQTPASRSSRLTKLSPPARRRRTTQRMQEIKATVLERLAAAQADRKAKLDSGRVDTVFKAGARVLVRTTELHRRRRHW